MKKTVKPDRRAVWDDVAAYLLHPASTPQEKESMAYFDMAYSICASPYGGFTPVSTIVSNLIERWIAE